MRGRAVASHAGRRPVNSAVAGAGILFVMAFGLAGIVTAIELASTNASRIHANPTAGEPSASNYRIDVNQAPVGDLSVLPGIGPTLARRIVKHRQRFGPFTDSSELEAVSRVGPATRKRIEPWIRFSTPRDGPVRFADQRR